MRILVGPWILALGACATEITPQSLYEALPQAEAEVQMDSWRASLDLANLFLASPANDLLPVGEIQLTENGMVFRTAEAEMPVRVLCSWWGNLVVWTGYVAQERSWGFVVGRQGDGPEVVANSFFRQRDLTPRTPAAMAELILHEMTHQWHQVGTVSALRGAVYYIQALSYGGGREHPQEATPYQVSADFWDWWRAKQGEENHNP